MRLGHRIDRERAARGLCETRRRRKNGGVQHQEGQKGQENPKPSFYQLGHGYRVWKQGEITQNAQREERDELV